MSAENINLYQIRQAKKRLLDEICEAVESFEELTEMSVGHIDLTHIPRLAAMRASEGEG